MAVDKQLLYDISIDTKSAVASINELNKNLGTLADTLSEKVTTAINESSKSVDSFGMVLVQINQAIDLVSKAWDAISEPFKESIKAFEEADQAIVKLSSTLEVIGERDIKGTMALYMQFSETMMQNTVVQDEQVQSLLAIGRAAGLSSDMVMKMVMVAADLSAVTGDSLESSFKSLQDSLKGVGRGLSIFNKDIIKLTEDELRNGRAIEILGEQYDGLAQKQVKSFSGAMKQMRNQMGELAESFGRLIVEVLNLGQSIEGKKGVLKSMTDGVDRLREALIALKDAIPALIVMLTSLAVALVAVKFTAIIAAVSKIATLFGLWAAAGYALIIPLTVITIKVVAIGAAIMSVVIAIDLLMSNWQKMGDIIESRAIKTPTKLPAEERQWSGGIAGKAIDSASKAWAALTGNAAKAADATDGVTDSTKRATAALDELTKRDTQDAIKERTMAMQNLKDMLDQFSTKAMEAGGSELDRIKAQAKAQENVLAKKIEEANLAKSINKLEVNLYDYQARRLINQAKMNELSALGVKQAKERNDAMKSIQDMVDDINMKSKEASAGEVDKINIKTEAQLRSIEAKAKELSLVRGINKETIAALASQAKSLAVSEGTSKILAAQKKAMDDITGANKDLEASFGNQFETQYQQSQRILKADLDRIALKQAQLKADGLLTKEMEIQLETARQLVAAKAKETGSPETKQFQAMTAGGAKAATAITGVFQKGTMGMVAGAGNVVMMIVQAIMGLADMITNFLQDLTSAFNKLSDLPSKILSLIPTLGQAVLKFTQQFLPQFLQMLPDMIMTGIEYFLEKIPEAADKMMESLPLLIEKLMDRLPDVVERFITSALKTAGHSVATIIKLAILYFSRIMPELFKSVIRDMIPALVNGIVEGVKAGMKSFGGVLNMGNIGKTLSGAFGKGVKVDTKDFSMALTKSFKQASQTLTGDASKIFGVENLTGVEKALKPADEAAKKIEESFKNGTDYLKMWWEKFLQYLKDIWTWIWNLIKPVFDGLKAIWDTAISLLQTLWNQLQGIWDNVVVALQALWSALESLWEMVITALQALWSALETIWTTVITALQTLWTAIETIWTTVFTKLQEAWAGLTSAWTDIWTKFGEIITKIKSLGQDIWNGLKAAIEAIPGFFSDLGTKIWDGLKSGISAVTTFFSDLGGKIWGGLSSAISTAKDGFSSFGTKIFNGLKAAFDGAPKLFSSLGGKIWQGLKDGLESAKDGFAAILSKLDPSSIMGKIFKVPADETKVGKGGTVENTLGINIPYVNFAKGGMVPGSAKMPGDSEINDRIVALLSPGEAIIPRSKMDRPEIKAIVDAILSGAISPQKYWGGSVSIGGHDVSVSDEGVKVDDVNIAPVNPLDAAADAMKVLWDQVKDQTFGMVMKMFEANKFHTGGLVPAFASGGEVPAMLQGGEYVINRNSVNQIGTGMLDRINAGRAPTTAQSPTFNISIDIKTTEPIDDAFFRQRVLPRVKDELKRSSLNGDFVISAKGIR